MNSVGDIGGNIGGELQLFAFLEKTPLNLGPF